MFPVPRPSAFSTSKYLIVQTILPYYVSLYLFTTAIVHVHLPTQDEMSYLFCKAIDYVAQRNVLCQVTHIAIAQIDTQYIFLREQASF